MILLQFTPTNNFGKMVGDLPISEGAKVQVLREFATWLLPQYIEEFRLRLDSSPFLSTLTAFLQKYKEMEDAQVKDIHQQLLDGSPAHIKISNTEAAVDIYFENTAIAGEYSDSLFKLLFAGAPDVPPCNIQRELQSFFSLRFRDYWNAFSVDYEGELSDIFVEGFF